MSIYIQGVEMPKCCAECDIEGYYENSYGMKYGFFCPLGYKEYTEDTRDVKRLDNCPLTHVPEHGDLIDRNALKDKWTHKDLDLFSQGWGWLRDLNQAPTVIPAEPPKEGI